MTPFEKEWQAHLRRAEEFEQRQRKMMGPEDPQAPLRALIGMTPRGRSVPGARSELSKIVEISDGGEQQ